MTTFVTAAQPSAFAIFRKRNFTLLWIAQFISMIGSGLTSIAASILVYRVTGSALSVGLMLIATALPNVLIGLIAGVFVDRWDRKRVMLATELLRGVLVVLVPLLLPFGIVWLYIIVALSSALDRFFTPAQASVLPETASDAEMAAANSLMTISESGALTLGYAAAGFIATALSLEWAFYLDGVSFLLSGLCIAFVRIAPLPVDERTSVAVVVRNLRAGIDVVRETPVLRALFLAFVPTFVLFGFGNALFLPFAIRALHATEFDYSLLEGISTIGFVIGGLLMVKLSDRLHQGQWVALSILSMGLVELVFALAPTIQLALAATLVTGLANAPSLIARRLIIQRNTPRAARGRVSSAFSVTRDTVFLLGMAAAGLADLFDVRVLLVIYAVLVFGCGMLVLVMPGLGQPSAEWRQMLRMLRTAPNALGLGLGRAALLADVDLLALRLPQMAALSSKERAELTSQARRYDAPVGTAVVRRGEASDAAYFLLDGQTVASRTEGGTENVMEVHSAGDFFGEIAALTSVPRTADVIASQPSMLLQVPAPMLRRMLSNPQMHRLFLSKMTERMLRMNMLELPRLASIDQQTLRELRTPDPALDITTNDER